MVKITQTMLIIYAVKYKITIKITVRVHTTGWRTPENTYAKGKKPFGFMPLVGYYISRIGKSTETENRWVFVRL